LAQDQTIDEAKKKVKDFQEKYPQLDFNLMSTVNGSEENYRYAVVLAEGLPSSVLAQAITKFARKCGIASDAYYYQQQ